MAKDFNGFEGYSTHHGNEATVKLHISGDTVDLPDASFVRDASLTRDGMDLVLEGPHGSVTVENYFAGDHAPALVAPDGSTLTPELVDSFARSAPEYAQNSSMSDESPIGAVQETTGEATVTHLNGSVENITVGTHIFQGDIIETSDNGAVNISFVDETNFAVSEDARLAIDEYVFDPATQSGETNFSVLKGVFVFTSGLIGRDDPDDVQIETPVGSIGIRGTIIAGNVNTGEITVVEGAIVLRDHAGHEMTLANQFETAKFNLGGTIDNMGTLSAHDVSSKFSVISQVSPTLFSSINDAAAEQDSESQAPDVDGSVDQNSDNEVDGTVQTAPDGTEATPADAPADGAQLAPPVVPVNPVVTTMGMQTGFGTDNSGLMAAEPSRGPALSPPPVNNVSNSVAETAPALGPAPVMHMLPVDQHVNLPSNTTTTAPPVNTLPDHHFGAPMISFAATAGIHWTYFFDKDFHDADGDTLTYQLSSATVDKLNDLRDTGGLDILDTWSFNSTNGQLMLNFTTNTGFLGVTPGEFARFAIEIHATDSNGGDSGMVGYTYDAWKPDLVSGATSINGGTGTPGDLFTRFVTDGNDNVTIGNTVVSGYNRIFAGNGDDTFEIEEGQYNYIYLGNGHNSVNIYNSASNVGNKIIGGDSNDTFEFLSADNAMVGMDGDDDYVINVGNSPLMTQLYNTTNTTTLLDGGHSQFRAGDAIGSFVPKLNHYATDGFTEMGRGDSLVLNGNGSINFSNINDNYIKNIERIDADNGSNNDITLNYSEVLAMTDQRHTLIINLDSGDKLQLTGSAFNLGNFTLERDNMPIDDARQGEAPVSHNYDVYTNGDVTLLISDSSSGGADVLFNGTAVTV